MDHQTVLDEVKEIIDLPGPIQSQQNIAENVELDSEIGVQMRDYLTHVASMYPDNPFHNFEHATHVTMSVIKLLSRIVAPTEMDRAYENDSCLSNDHTYGITSDPLTQFSCVFSALIHDVDHPGLPNVQLVSETTELAMKYNNRSIAEQNSVDLAWSLLMNERYSKLRSKIYVNDTEMRRFRQLVVNSVMATDIADKEQKTFRDDRWKMAFHSDIQENVHDTINRKATIVIEHLIQASDVSHTMQHVRFKPARWDD
jgi:3'5'-cyclic nucleotide phosphodiesterase